MKDNIVETCTVSKDEAVKMTSENKYGAVWPAGLYVIIDNQRCVLETRNEAEELIEQIRKATDELWPQR